MKTDRRRTNGRSRRWRLRGLALVLLLAMAPMSAAAAGQVTAGEALAAKDEANQLRDELRSLDERGEVNVDQDVLATVDREIEKGRLAVDSGEYGEAKDHFDRATAQARAELARSYAEGAKTVLNGTGDYLNSLREQGYTTAEIGVLRERIAKQRRGLQGADDLDSARSAYANARSIREDAKALPRPDVVRAVDLLTSIWWVLVVAVLALVAAAGWYTRTNSDETDGPQLH